jgi:hypothetical protein
LEPILFLRNVLELVPDYMARHIPEASILQI